MSKIAIVVPTIRPDKMLEFIEAWEGLFRKHSVVLVTIFDGDNPVVQHEGQDYTPKDILGKYKDVFFNHTSACKNLGLAYVARFLPEVETIVVLDDDVKPIGDTIQDHLNALGQRVPISWMKTASLHTRGFPYAVRSEAEVVLSHGVWEGVKDWDAPAQLVSGNPDTTFYKGPIPKSVYYPMCGMNIAFKRKLLPFMYFAPSGHRVGIDRFDDIWAGIISKRFIDKLGWAVVSGYAMVFHERASNVFKNLQKEAKGIELNEGFWQGQQNDPYFELYDKKFIRWQEFINAQ